MVVAGILATYCDKTNTMILLVIDMCRTTLNPTPETLNPKPKTLNLKP